MRPFNVKQAQVATRDLQLACEMKAALWEKPLNPFELTQGPRTERGDSLVGLSRVGREPENCLVHKPHICGI